MPLMRSKLLNLEYIVYLTNDVLFYTGKVSALDINKGRLRILMEAAKCHNLDDIITDIHGDLRLYAVSFQETS